MTLESNISAIVELKNLLYFKAKKYKYAFNLWFV